MMKRLLFCCVVLSGCGVQNKIGKMAGADILQAEGLRNAHVGISVYDPATKKYLYNYQSDKYFVPASNTKLFTCYAAMKWLGDSIAGIRYREKGNDLLLLPTGDPTFMHPDYKVQPVQAFLQGTKKEMFIADGAWEDEGLGYGWSWDDYNSSYMAERSPLPVFGNTIRWIQNIDTSTEEKSASVFSVPEVDWKVRFNPDSGSKAFSVRRNRAENVFVVTEGKEVTSEQEVPYVTNGITSGMELINSSLGKDIHVVAGQKVRPDSFRVIRSQPVDSLLRPMMHRSDNFFAEQSLLMVANERLGVMSIRKIVDTLLKAELKGIPQVPRWVDGSGLSRYNLFTPLDFVYILEKMNAEFGWERVTRILPTGNAGTLSGYYKNEGGLIYAKTGTLSGHVALSGYLITTRGRRLIFSVLVNNHQTSAVAVRRAVEKFLREVREM